jgi:hypothetical protein
VTTDGRLVWRIPVGRSNTIAHLIYPLNVTAACGEFMTFYRKPGKDDTAPYCKDCVMIEGEHGVA